ncbi:MAG TPA: MarR family transcriptional regulator [Kofleriaceae bacterium]|jgi:DNA-binding MarR family transcriptional regulator
MNLETARLALESGDMANWSAVARDLGRQLAAQVDRSKPWLLSFRRLVAGLRPRRAGDYDRGFLDALELVATGFERQLDDTVRDETEVLQLRAHPSWIAALRYIDQGVVRPSDLAEKLEVSPSAVTKLVDELEQAHLVTQTTQGRERPCRLTPRARSVLGRLPPPDTTPVASDVMLVVPAVVTCVTTLIRDRRVARERFLDSLRHTRIANPAGVLEVLDRSLRDASCAVLDDDDAWVATDAALLDRLQQHVALACQNRPGTVVERLARLSERSELVLRVGGGVSTWDSAVGQLGRIQVIRDDELRCEAPLLAGEFQLVYESPSLLVADRRQWREWTERATTAAIGRYHLGIAHGPVVPDFNLIEVEMPEYPA